MDINYVADVLKASETEHCLLSHQYVSNSKSAFILYSRNKWSGTSFITTIEINNNKMLIYILQENTKTQAIDHEAINIETDDNGVMDLGDCSAPQMQAAYWLSHILYKLLLRKYLISHWGFRDYLPQNVLNETREVLDIQPDRVHINDKSFEWPKTAIKSSHSRHKSWTIMLDEQHNWIVVLHNPNNHNVEFHYVDSQKNVWRFLDNLKYESSAKIVDWIAKYPKFYRLSLFKNILEHSNTTNAVKEDIVEKITGKTDIQISTAQINKCLKSPNMKHQLMMFHQLKNDRCTMAIYSAHNYWRLSIVTIVDASPETLDITYVWASNLFKEQHKLQAAIQIDGSPESYEQYKLYADGVVSVCNAMLTNNDYNTDYILGFNNQKNGIINAAYQFGDHKIPAFEEVPSENIEMLPENLMPKATTQTTMGGNEWTLLMDEQGNQTFVYGTIDADQTNPNDRLYLCRIDNAKHTMYDINTIKAGGTPVPPDVQKIMNDIMYPADRPELIPPSSLQMVSRHMMQYLDHEWNTSNTANTMENMQESKNSTMQQFNEALSNPDLYHQMLFSSTNHLGEYHAAIYSSELRDNQELRDNHQFFLTLITGAKDQLKVNGLAYDNGNVQTYSMNFNMTGIAENTCRYWVMLNHILRIAAKLEPSPNRNYCQKFVDFYHDNKYSTNDINTCRHQKSVLGNTLESAKIDYRFTQDNWDIAINQNHHCAVMYTNVMSKRTLPEPESCLDIAIVNHQSWDIERYRFNERNKTPMKFNKEILTSHMLQIANHDEGKREIMLEKIYSTSPQSKYDLNPLEMNKVLDDPNLEHQLLYYSADQSQKVYAGVYSYERGNSELAYVTIVEASNNKLFITYIRRVGERVEFCQVTILKKKTVESSAAYYQTGKTVVNIIGSFCKPLGVPKTLQRYATFFQDAPAKHSVVLYSQNAEQIPETEYSTEDAMSIVSDYSNHALIVDRENTTMTALYCVDDKIHAAEINQDAHCIFTYDSDQEYTEEDKKYFAAVLESYREIMLECNAPKIASKLKNALKQLPAGHLEHDFDAECQEEDQANETAACNDEITLTEKQHDNGLNKIHMQLNTSTTIHDLLFWHQNENKVSAAIYSTPKMSDGGILTIIEVNDSAYNITHYCRENNKQTTYHAHLDKNTTYGPNVYNHIHIILHLLTHMNPKNDEEFNQCQTDLQKDYGISLNIKSEQALSQVINTKGSVKFIESDSTKWAVMLDEDNHWTVVYCSTYGDCLAMAQVLSKGRTASFMYTKDKHNQLSYDEWNFLKNNHNYLNKFNGLHRLTLGMTAAMHCMPKANQNGPEKMTYPPISYPNRLECDQKADDTKHYHMIVKDSNMGCDMAEGKDQEVVIANTEGPVDLPKHVQEYWDQFKEKSPKAYYAILKSMQEAQLTDSMKTTLFMTKYIQDLMDAEYTKEQAAIKRNQLYRKRNKF